MDGKCHGEQQERKIGRAGLGSKALQRGHSRRVLKKVSVQARLTSWGKYRPAEGTARGKAPRGLGLASWRKEERK